MFFKFFVALSLTASSAAFAAADRQSFAGAGLGFEVLSKQGSGTGFYFQGQAGYAFTSAFALGLNAGYSNIGTVDVRMLDFGAFLQLTDQESGVYGKMLLGGVNAHHDGVAAHGVSGTDTGFAAGAALGLLIPSGGDLHLVPELAYRAAFLAGTVHLIAGTVNLVWDY